MAKVGVGAALSGDDLLTDVRKVVNSSVDGFSDGFMVGSVLSDIATSLNPALSKSYGVKISNINKELYGRLTLGFLLSSQTKNPKRWKACLLLLSTILVSSIKIKRHSYSMAIVN